MNVLYFNQLECLCEFDDANGIRPVSKGKSFAACIYMDSFLGLRTAQAE